MENTIEETSGSSATSTSNSKSSSTAAVSTPAHEPQAAAFAQTFEKICQLIEDRFSKMNSKIEALSISAASKLGSPSAFESHIRASGGTGEKFDSPHGFPSRSRSDHRPSRQSLGSYRSLESHCAR
jgi:hypothetical protein